MIYTKRKVIEGLMACSDSLNGCTKCPFHDCGCFPELKNAIVELLERQGEQQGIDPETLPIVRGLREKLVKCEPAVHANWIQPVPGDGDPYCSHCKNSPLCYIMSDEYEFSDYCPNCGAKMNEGAFDDTETIC